MGATQRTLSFSVTVEKYEHWSKEHLEECEKGNAAYDDYVIEKLEAVMRKAGEEFVNSNPDLFRGLYVI